MQKIRVSRPVFDLLDIHSIEQSGEAVESLLLIGCSRKIAPLHANTLVPVCQLCHRAVPRSRGFVVQKMAFDRMHGCEGQQNWPKIATGPSAS